MADNNKVNIKLEIYRNKTNGKLSLLVRFDTKANNIVVEKDNYSWLPTTEEIELINEAFEIFSNKKTPISTFSPEKIIEKHLEKPSNESSDKKENIAKNKDAVEDEEDVLETGDESIEEAIKKHIKDEDEDDVLKEADEHTIIDKVLSQKKKGRWKKI